MVDTEPHGPGISADEALQRLIDGNERFLRGETHFPRLQKDILINLAKGQKPYATILGCSDSRVPPELIFDSGFGGLFVVRVAGNTVSAEVMGSFQYAGAHLLTPLFLILGHAGCGAVNAALETKFRGVQHRSRIQILGDSILPGMPNFDPHLPPEVCLAQAVEANVRWTIRQLRETPEARERLASGQVKLVGAIYEIATGRVRLME
jgi:carbonic anhydrase